MTGQMTGRLVLARALRLGLHCLLGTLLVLGACTGGTGVPLAPANSGPTPTTHDRFPIATGPHALDCNSCHGSFSSFTQYTCLNCHGHDLILALIQFMLQMDL